MFFFSVQTSKKHKLEICHKNRRHEKLVKNVKTTGKFPEVVLLCSEHERLSLSCDELALGVHKTPNRKQAYRAPPQVLPSFLVTTLL
jgi:hypothetical protein